MFGLLFACYSFNIRHDRTFCNYFTVVTRKKVKKPIKGLKNRAFRLNIGKKLVTTVIFLQNVSFLKEQRN